MIRFVSRITSFSSFRIADSFRFFQVGLRDYSIEDSNAFMKINDLSPQTSEMIDQEINRLLNESYMRAKEVLVKHKVCIKFCH